MVTLAPGPKSSILGLNHVGELMADQPQFVLNLQEQYGPVARFRIADTDSYLISDPDLLHQVLIADAEIYEKSTRTKAIMGKFIGNGLLLSDGAFWKRQRQLMQPAFHHKRLEGYVEIMTGLTAKHLSTWRDGDQRLAFNEMMQITLGIVAKSLMNVNTESIWETIHEALGFLQAATVVESRTVLPLGWMPHVRERRRKFDAYSTQLYDVVREIIAQRRKDPVDHGDLLSMILLAVDEDGSGMTDQQALDEVITALLAGYETTAGTLTWLFYLLAQHPEVEQKLHEEVDRVLGGRTPTLADLSNMPYVDKVFKETLRLYPAAFIFLREPIVDTVIGGYPIKARSTILISPYALHRNPALFEDPLAFRPERFDNEKSWHKLAYLPFSTGPRVCIGNAFALMEGRVVMAMIAQRFRLTTPPTYKAEYLPQITLGTKDGIPVTIRTRTQP